MRLDLQLPQRGALWLVLIVLSLALLACDDDSPTAPEETPDVPEAPRMTETFSGMFGQNGTSFHPFTIVAIGSTETTITDLQPVPTLTVGLGIGTEDGAGGCTTFAQDNTVKVGQVLLTSSLDVGNYCVAIFDVGNVFPDATVTYTLQVTHP